MSGRAWVGPWLACAYLFLPASVSTSFVAPVASVADATVDRSAGGARLGLEWQSKLAVVDRLNLTAQPRSIYLQQECGIIFDKFFRDFGLGFLVGSGRDAVSVLRRFPEQATNAGNWRASWLSESLCEGRS